ncbi:MAG: hypothetical protein ABS45_12930 [Comamonas sp. SCN 65-56]|nr:MAG: hypothetical protein ABS45_12930 [Comamonas sp. SCN 65-56]
MRLRAGGSYLFHGSYPLCQLAASATHMALHGPFVGFLLFTPLLRSLRRLLALLQHVAQTGKARLGSRQLLHGLLHTLLLRLHHDLLHLRCLFQPLQELQLMAQHLRQQARTFARTPALARLLGVTGELGQLSFGIGALAALLHQHAAGRITLALSHVYRHLERAVSCHGAS